MLVYQRVCVYIYIYSAMLVERLERTSSGGQGHAAKNGTAAKNEAVGLGTVKPHFIPNTQQFG